MAFPLRRGVGLMMRKTGSLSIETEEPRNYRGGGPRYGLHHHAVGHAGVL